MHAKVTHDGLSLLVERVNTMPYICGRAQTRPPFCSQKEKRDENAMLVALMS